MYRFYASPTTLDEALALKAYHGEAARVIAGGTDLLIEMDRGQRHAPDGGELGLIDLTRIPGLAEIRQDAGHIQLGPLVTHNQALASELIVARAFPLARACWEVGAPQIRNRATIAGNIITASPSNDTLVPLVALEATVTLQSAARGERTLPLRDFYTGFRKVDLAADELLTRISFAPLNEHQEGAYIKLGLRRAQAITVNNIAAVITWNAGHTQVEAAVISLGAVAPVIVRATAAEQFLTGKPLTDEVIERAAQLAVQATSPIDDVRSSAAYRRAMVETLTARILAQIRDGQARAGWPIHPVMLWGETAGVWPVMTSQAQDNEAQNEAAASHVNGQAVVLPGSMTLLDSLRLAGFVGVKEGCAEGECGSCTVFLDGMAVMACLVPAERAAGSRVVTVEGLGDPANLHPVQAAFIQSGGVQCGYCTPGFVMSAAKLLEERSHPTRAEAQEALTGNFCRCTGYRKILDAIVAAGAAEPQQTTLKESKP
ncbi:MAG: FAD binding domain-containing protein [Caldilineaceae bacterium]|nr:FAD binding domain-containing protein [Caldilineaceae bacterium]